MKQQKQCSSSSSSTNSSQRRPRRVQRQRATGARNVLLRCGLLPDYKIMLRSSDAMENHFALLQQKSPRQQSPRQHQQAPLVEVDAAFPVNFLVNAAVAVEEGNFTHPRRIPPSGESKNNNGPPLADEGETIEQRAILLHAIFIDFCSPPPTIANILAVLTKEGGRVRNSCRHCNGDGGTTNDGGDKLATASQHKQQDLLLKEAIIHTNPNAAQYIIGILRHHPKQCISRLPLGFVLAFFRILSSVLLATDDTTTTTTTTTTSTATNNVDEVDDYHCYYEKECLFSRTTTSQQEKEVVGIDNNQYRRRRGDEGESNNDDNDMNTTRTMRGDDHGNDDHDDDDNDDDSYNILPKNRALSFSASSIATSTTTPPLINSFRRSSTIGSSNIGSSNRLSPSFTPRAISGTTDYNSVNNNHSSNTTKKAFETWSYGRWKRRRSAPLYSVVRFRCNNKWSDIVPSSSCRHRRYLSSGTSSSSSLFSLRRSWWDDNDALLVDDDEARCQDEDVEDSDSDDDDDGTIGEDIIGTLIRIYRATMTRCLNDHNFNHKHNNDKKDDNCSNDNDDDDVASVDYLLLGPVAHLIGLVCATGVSVRNLRLLLILAGEGGGGVGDEHEISNGNNGNSSNSTHQSIMDLSRLHIIRALRYAAEYSVRSNGIIDRPGPQAFFSFGKEGGMSSSSSSSSTTSGLSVSLDMTWPFKYDFGMACWFRTESFMASTPTEDCVLFSARSYRGATIEISFESHSVESMVDGSGGSVATLFVTVIDADPTSKLSRRVRLVGCVLSPLVWYHVAVRLTRSKLSRFSLTSKDEVSIFLNGKLMLKEHMKLPQFPDLESKGFAGFGSTVEPPKGPMELSFFSNFDGQAGTLYVFKDHVSEETIRALYHETSASSEQHNNLSHFGSFIDQWDTNHGKLNNLTKAVSSASMFSDLEDVVLPNYSIFTGEYNHKPKIFFDLVKDDDIDPEHIPVGLTNLALGSKILIVWDPCRVVNGLLMEPHLGAHVDVEGAPTWSFESVRDTIESLGGMSRIILLFEILASPISQQNGQILNGIVDDYPNILIPDLVFLVSSFIREHEFNTCELYRCGGINLIEKLLHDCKEMDIKEGASYRLGVSPIVAKYSASAFVDLWQASRSAFALEMTVFSRILFNMSLLLGGVATSRGGSFPIVMLPILSEIATMNPDKVRDCIDFAEVFDIVNQYSNMYDEPSSEDQLAISTTDECFVVDVLLGMVVTMLTQRCPSSALFALLTFITHNLDLEWEDVSACIKNNDADRTIGRRNRHLSTVKAVAVLFFLLQKSPRVPSLYDSLAEIFENDGTSSWLLCSLVNSFDDTIRGLGIKCLSAYLNSLQTADKIDSAMTPPLPTNRKIQRTVKLGLEAANNMLSSVLSGRVNTKVTYKLLWHLLKCHRERLGITSNAALMYLIMNDGSAVFSTVLLSDIIVSRDDSLGGVFLSVDDLIIPARIESRQCLTNTHGVSMVFRLLKYLSNEHKERWLFDLLSFLLASTESVKILLACDDWQPVLFQLVAEVLEEIHGGDSSDPQSQSAVNTDTLSKPSVRTRYDLSLKLYSTLLSHCVRQGDDIAFSAVEMAAALQRVDVNGPEIFSILLSHLLADLIEKGTVTSVGRTYNNNDTSSAGRNRALKQSARLVTQSILSNGKDGVDLTSAVRQWRCLRYLTALTVAVVTESGFGVVHLFDYMNQDASAVDGITGGLYGIRLDNLVSGVNAFEALAGAKLHSNRSGRHQRDGYRYVTVVLASQILTLLDAFIFPDDLDTEQTSSQMHGLALVTSTEPRLGQSQGTLLSSLIRLSLILLAFLEPSSVKFLQCCSRLRCFLHWVLEILRESVTLGGYSQAFHELTAPLDRIVLAIVLQCHRALSRCSVVLVEIESNPWEKYFCDVETQQKSKRRIFRATLEQREIVLAAYKGRKEVFRAALSSHAYEALSRALDEPYLPNDMNFQSKEASLRAFLKSDWVTGFCDVEGQGQLIIPEQLSSGQIYQERRQTTIGKQAIEALATESTQIVKEYTTLLNAPFTLYCENQRKWAETDAVRDREYEGDVSVKRLSNKYRMDIVDINKAMMARFLLVLQRLSSISLIASGPWRRGRHWMFTSCTDLLYRRIILQPNCYFDNHADACYELSLGKDREREEEGIRKRLEEKARKEREMAEAALRATIVPYNEAMDDEDLDDDISDKSGTEGFLGWEVKSGDDSSTQPTCNGDDDSVVREVAHDGFETAVALNTDTKDADESEWNQIESADFDDSDQLDPFAWARKFMWAEGERFVQSFESVLIVSIQHIKKGTLLLTSHSIYFHKIGDTIDVMTKEKLDVDDEPTKHDRKWKLNRLTDIHGRRYMLKAQALELFFANMEGIFLAFDGIKDRDAFHSKLRGNCRVPLLRSFKSLNPRVVFKKSKLTDLWRKRKISNFQYIMALNLMAGRTFNDITQYPVFPWILADYTSETLDLSDMKVYRDLTKPVGALNPERLAQLIDRYHDLDGFPEEEKFLYGSHYSSPGVVLHYLIRQEPYTSMHITLQSGRFDCSDRLFFDLASCWRSCNTSTSDVKELLPEFFSSPEIFTNTNNFPLGKTQGQMSIDNVKLPPWAKGSPHEFVRLHRLALESENVSNNLNHWIDLIFGYKQRGPAALAANNVFHYLCYEGSVDIDKVEDELERSAIEGHIQNFGQTPSQLIPKEPHPSRSGLRNEAMPLFQDLCLENMRCDTPKKQFGRSDASAIISMHAIGDAIYVMHADFTFCTYKLHHTRGDIPFHFRIDKVKALESKDVFFSNRTLTSEVDTSRDERQPQRNLSFAIALGVHTRAANGGSSGSDPTYLLFSCGYFDDSIKIHSLDSLQLQSKINGVHRGRINCLEVEDEGAIMVTGGDDATCSVWIVDHDALASAITDGFVKSSLGRDRSEETKCYHAHMLLGHVTPVCCVTMCTKLDVVLSGSLDGSICIHNIRSGKFIRALHIDAETETVQESCARNGIPVKKLAIHSDGFFVAHFCDGSLYVISINGQQLCSANIGERLNTMIICPESETVITGGDIGCVRVWALRDLTLRCTVDVKKNGSITSLIRTTGSPHFLCIGSSNGMVSIVSRQ